MDIFLVVANGSAGKSATIRALTGARKRGLTNIEFAQGNLVRQVWVEIRSLQENNISPQEMIQILAQSACNEALLALRFGPLKGQPNAQCYINQLVNAGHVIGGSGEIGALPAHLNYGGVVDATNLEPQAQNTAANQRAALLRRAWNIT